MTPHPLTADTDFIKGLHEELTRAAARLGSRRDLQQDHVQQALMVFLGKLGAGSVDLSGTDDEAKERATGYARGILKWVVRGAQRKMARDMVLSIGMLGDAPIDTLAVTPSEDVVVDQVMFVEAKTMARSALMEAASKLSPALKRLFTYDLEHVDSDVKDAAAALGITEANVRKLRERYRRKLAENPNVRAVADLFAGIVYVDIASDLHGSEADLQTANPLAASLINELGSSLVSPAEFVARLGGNPRDIEAVLSNYERLTGSRTDRVDR